MVANDYTSFLSTVWPNCPALHLDIKSNQVFVGKQRKSHQIFVKFENPRSWLVTEYSRSLSFSQFVSNIGGTLGIWTGSSIVSSLHLVVCFANFVRSRLRGQQANVAVNNNNTDNNLGHSPETCRCSIALFLFLKWYMIGLYFDFFIS